MNDSLCFSVVCYIQKTCAKIHNNSHTRVQKLVKRVENDTNGYFLHTITSADQNHLQEFFTSCPFGSLSEKEYIKERLSVVLCCRRTCGLGEWLTARLPQAIVPRGSRASFD